MVDEWQKSITIIEIIKRERIRNVLKILLLMLIYNTEHAIILSYNEILV